MEAIVGAEGLGAEERRFLRFADRFENELIQQGAARRTVAETLDLGWRLLADFPASSLSRVRAEHAARHLPKGAEDGEAARHADGAAPE